MFARGCRLKVVFFPESNSKHKKNKNFQYVNENGIETVEKFTKKFQEISGIESRATVLGHIQRGGTPTAHDRVLSARYGYAAVELAMRGGFGRMVTLQGDEISDVSLEDVIAKHTENVEPDGELVKVAKAMGVCFGD